MSPGSPFRLGLRAAIALFLCTTAAEAREPVYYAWEIDGNPNVQSDAAWPGTGNSLSATIPLNSPDLAPGAHTAAITVHFDDGSVTPPAVVKFFVEPDAESANPLYYAWTIRKEQDHGNPVVDADAPWPGPGRSLAETIHLDSVKPGAHTAAISVHLDDGSVTPPAVVKFFVEPDAQASYLPPATDPYLELLDENGAVVFSGLLTQIEPGRYEVYVPIDSMDGFYDLTLRPRLSLTDAAGTNFLSNPASTDPLFRQQNYYDWLDSFAPGLPTWFYADEDGDGLTQILEWYLKTNPLVFDGGVAPSVHTELGAAVFSWTARGGIESFTAGFYEVFGGEFGLQRQAYGLEYTWNWGLPHLAIDESVFEIRRTPLDGGLERVEVVVPLDSPEVPIGSFFLRWAPASDF